MAKRISGDLDMTRIVDMKKEEIESLHTIYFYSGFFEEVYAITDFKEQSMYSLFSYKGETLGGNADYRARGVKKTLFTDTKREALKIYQQEHNSLISPQKQNIMDKLAKWESYIEVINERLEKLKDVVPTCRNDMTIKEYQDYTGDFWAYQYVACTKKLESNIHFYSDLWWETKVDTIYKCKRFQSGDCFGAEKYPSAGGSFNGYRVSKNKKHAIKIGLSYQKELFDERIAVCKHYLETGEFRCNGSDTVVPFKLPKFNLWKYLLANKK